MDSYGRTSEDRVKETTKSVWNINEPDREAERIKLWGKIVGMGIAENKENWYLDKKVKNSFILKTFNIEQMCNKIYVYMKKITTKKSIE